jgi:probable rRNA maturation factor
LAALEKFLARACREVGVAPESLTVCLVTNAEIAKWNRAYRSKDGPTDVLSFAAHGTDQAGARRRRRRPRANPSSATDIPAARSDDCYLGDVAIAPAVARRNAARFGRTVDQEMRILILHGILHLLGYDHETDNGQMDRRERRLRRSLGLA